MPKEAFLSPFGQDIVAIIGVGGFVLTAIGVFLAWRQMRRTTSAAQAATDAAVTALDESRAQYNHYVIAQCSRLLTEIRVYVKNSSWDVAALRLGDLADQLLQVAKTDPSWTELAGRLQTMEKSFDRIHNGEVTFSDSLQGKWNKVDRDLRTIIAENHGPFTQGKSGEHDEQRSLS